MTECNAFNLLEGYILKESTTSIDSAVASGSVRSNSVDERNNHLLLTIKSSDMNLISNDQVYRTEKCDTKKYVQPLDQLFLNIKLGNTSEHDSEIFLTPSVSITGNNSDHVQSKIELKNEDLTPTPPQRPKRPYSYYVATNFHPLDLSTIENEIELKKLIEPQSDIINPNNKKDTNKKDEEVAVSNKRLSMSLGDIKMRRNRGRANTTANKNNEKKSKKFSSQNGIDVKNEDEDCTTKASGEVKIEPTSEFINTGSSTTLPRNGTTRKSHHRSTSRINRFFRLLFRIGDEDVNNDAVVVDDEEIYKNDGALNKFTRFFSFRGSNTNMSSKTATLQSTANKTASINRIPATPTVTNTTQNNDPTLIVMDEQPSKVLPKIQLNFNPSNSPPKTAPPIINRFVIRYFYSYLRTY